MGLLTSLETRSTESKSPSDEAANPAFHKPVILLLVIYVLAGLMVSNFRYLSLRQLDLRKRHPFWLLLSAILLIKLGIAEPQIMLFGVFLLYTLSGPLLGLFSMFYRGREKRGETAESL